MAPKSRSRKKKTPEETRIAKAVKDALGPEGMQQSMPAALGELVSTIVFAVYCYLNDLYRLDRQRLREELTPELMNSVMAKFDDLKKLPPGIMENIRGAVMIQVLKMIVIFREAKRFAAILGACGIDIDSDRVAFDIILPMTEQI